MTRAAARRTADWAPHLGVLVARQTRRGALRCGPPRPARKSPGKRPSAGAHPAVPRPPGQPGMTQLPWAMGGDPGTARRPGTGVRPAAATGAQTRLPLTRAPLPPPARPPRPARRARVTRLEQRDMRRPALAGLGTCRPRQAVREPHQDRGPAAEQDGGGATRPRTASPAQAPPGRPRPRSRSAAALRHGRTRGAARTGGPVRRSREDRGTVPATADPRPGGRCGAPGHSGRRGPAGAARSGDSRPRLERPIRCTRRASSRRGTRPRSAPSAPPGGPDWPPDPIPKHPSRGTRCWP
jgi:hypothetical protein